MPCEMERLTVEPICTLPPGAPDVTVTDDGHVVAFVSQDDGRLTFLWDGDSGESFDMLMTLRDESPGVFASPDGHHVAWVGMRGSKAIVGRDGREEGPWDDFSRSVPPVFGGDLHLAYGAKPAGGREMRLILDGEPMGSTEIAPIAAALSSDGERLAFVEMQGTDRDDLRVRIVLDGQPGEWFVGMRNAVGALQFSPDGRRFAHYTTDGKGHARWSVDGIGQRLINDTHGFSLARIRGVGVLDQPLPARFSPDSRRFAYFADVAEKGVAIIEDDMPGPLFRAVHGPVFSADSRHLAYAAQTYRRTCAVVLDGAVIGEWPAIASTNAAFSPDGARIALLLERDAGGLFRKRRVWSSVVDGHESSEEPGTDAAVLPIWSGDSRHAAWWLERAAGAPAVLVIDGRVQPSAWLVDSDLCYDAAGRLVYVGKADGHNTVVVGDEPGPLAEEVVRLRTLAERFGRDPWAVPSVPFRLSRDGRVAWAGVFDQRHHPVLGDEVGPAFDQIIGCRVDPDAVTWWACREGAAYRVKRAMSPNSAVEPA